MDDFAELLIPSGLVLVDTHFVSFHSPYDFGYLLKVLTNRNLPDEEDVSMISLLNLCFFLSGNIPNISCRCSSNCHL